MIAQFKSFFTQEKSSPPRHFTAKDLIQEWSNAAHHDYSSKASARGQIVGYQHAFLREDPVNSYHLDIYHRYDSIIKLVTDQDTSLGAEENRTCKDGFSKLHKLRCGHRVYAEHACRCGANCQEPHLNDVNFFCLLCTRDAMKIVHQVKPSTRWHDLLLPTMAQPGRETAEWAQNEYIMRKVEPAYLDSHGYIILPRIHYMIAMVRASEIRQENLVKEAMTKNCSTGFGGIPNIDTVAAEYFEHFLVYHSSFDHADMRTLAVLAIRLAVHLRTYGRLPVNQDVLLEKFGAPHNPKINDLFLIAQNNITDWAATLLLEHMLSRLPRENRVGTTVLEIRKISMRIWTKVVERSVYLKETQWEMRTRIMALCVDHALRCCRKTTGYDQILELIGVEKNNFMDVMVRAKFQHFVAGTDWTKDVSTARSKGTVRDFQLKPA